MQMDILALEKTKVELEIENIRLSNEKKRLQIEELLARC
jgi:hypothetical protein